MPGQPLKHAVISQLAELAKQEIGEDATALDYVCHWIEGGERTGALQKRIESLIGTKFSTPFFSGVINHGLGPNAKERLRQSRADAGPALVEKAREVVENAPTDDKVKFEKAREESKILLWQAERQDRATYGQQQPVAQVNLNVGSMHLDAFRAISHSAPQSPQNPVQSPKALGPGEEAA